MPISLMLDNEDFTKTVDSLREKCLGGPYCRDVSQVAIGAVLGLQPDDNPEVFSVLNCHRLFSTRYP
jgi:hypothetical protein